MPSGGVHPITYLSEAFRRVGKARVVFGPFVLESIAAFRDLRAADGNVVATIRLDRRDAVAKIEIVLVDVQQDVASAGASRSLG